MMNPGGPSVPPLRPSETLDTLERLGFGGAIAAPDGFLGEILLRIEQEKTMRLVHATHRAAALAKACGTRLGGVRTAMFVQNAGLLSMGAGRVCLTHHRGSGHD
jgi:sulfopyruvate decarboxylase subunit alpha